MKYRSVSHQDFTGIINQLNELGAFKNVKVSEEKSEYELLLFTVIRNKSEYSCRINTKDMKMTVEFGRIGFKYARDGTEVEHSVSIQYATTFLFGYLENVLELLGGRMYLTSHEDGLYTVTYKMREDKLKFERVCFLTVITQLVNAIVLTRLNQIKSTKLLEGIT